MQTFLLHRTDAAPKLQSSLSFLEGFSVVQSEFSGGLGDCHVAVGNQKLIACTYHALKGMVEWHPFHYELHRLNIFIGKSTWVSNNMAIAASFLLHKFGREGGGTPPSPRDPMIASIMSLSKNMHPLWEPEASITVLLRWPNGCNSRLSKAWKWRGCVCVWWRWAAPCSKYILCKTERLNCERSFGHGKVTKCDWGKWIEKYALSKRQPLSLWRRRCWMLPLNCFPSDRFYEQLIEQKVTGLTSEGGVGEEPEIMIGVVWPEWLLFACLEKCCVL